MPIEMKQGIYIDYRIKLNGIPFSWKTLISSWEPPHRFVDEQIKGPYMRWHHTHSFKSVDENTTEMTDRIEYLSPGWILEPLINRLFVQKKVEAIFAYRERKLLEIFAR